jgi:hypothetical protein
LKTPPEKRLQEMTEMILQMLMVSYFPHTRTTTTTTLCLHAAHLVLQNTHGLSEYLRETTQPGILLLLLLSPYRPVPDLQI